MGRRAGRFGSYFTCLGHPRYPGFMPGSRPTPFRVAVALAMALSAVAPAARAAGKAPDPAAIEQAKRHMKAGATFYNDPGGHKCEEALREFTKAFELSGSLNARKGMAICNLELERDDDAIADYTAYLEGKGSSIDAAEKAQIEADLGALKAAVARVAISADRPGVRVVDVRTPSKGFPIRNAYTLEKADRTLGVHPGQHVFTASLEGHPDQVWQVDIANGGSYAHTFSFTRAPQPAPAPALLTPRLAGARPVPTSVWITAGVTGALGVAWGVLAVRARILNDDFTKVNGTRPAAELEEQRSGVKTANVVADVFLGAAVAALGTTAALYFTRPTIPREAGKAARAPQLRLSPTAGLSGGGVLLQGAF